MPTGDLGHKSIGDRQPLVPKQEVFSSQLFDDCSPGPSEPVTHNRSGGIPASAHLG